MLLNKLNPTIWHTYIKLLSKYKMAVVSCMYSKNMNEKVDGHHDHYIPPEKARVSNT